mmetsp:Transcript_13297/g.31500  ORF Transcript_13297/g.31500 Transcript_13297/m.31500 type:complete len:847 (+) Transcript_13297:88-2628(+)
MESPQMCSSRRRRSRARTTAGAAACDACTCQETAGTMSKSPLQRLLPAALLVHILIAVRTATVAAAFVGPALSFGPHAASRTISTSVRRHVSSPSSGTGDDASPSTDERSNEWDADANASEGKRRIVIRGNKPKPIVPKKQLTEHPVQTSIPSGGFNVVLTHCTADFDSLASAVGLAKLWSSEGSLPIGGKAALSDDNGGDSGEAQEDDAYKSSSTVPTFVVLPRGAHPGVQKFLALHKHLFPIRSLKSLPSDLSSLNRLGLVDAQRRDRLGPAEPLLGHANRVTIVDHHIDGESDIPEATDYVVEKVGSVSTMIAERLRDAGLELSEAEATLLALGIHADTGSLCFDSTTARDGSALAWTMEQGASQAAIAEHGKSSLSSEQQGVLTQALINTNTTEIHGVTLSTVLLSAEGFINGLAAVAQDALELTSSDVYLLSVVYDAKSGSGRKRKNKNKSKEEGSPLIQARLFGELEKEKEQFMDMEQKLMATDSWKGGEMATKRRKLRAAFNRKDIDGSGYLERNEIVAVLASSNIICNEDSLDKLMKTMDTNGDGRIDFEEFLAFSEEVENKQSEQEHLTGRRQSTMIIIGRVKAGINTKDVNLNTLFQQFGGGGHAKAASATVRLGDESDAGDILEGIVAEMIDISLVKQPTAGDFMTSPVLSAKATMTEKHVEDLFIRYDVRSLPVVDDDNNVIGLVTYKEVAAAKQRLWNKEQKRIRQEAKLAADIAAGKNVTKGHDKNVAMQRQRNQGSALKGWMLQHVEVVEASKTMAEVEALLLDADVGCIPVVADGTMQLVGMVTRTDLLRQHQYYDGLHYHNKGFADSIAARKPIIELRKRLKKFDDLDA